MTTKRVQNRPDLLKDEHSGAVLASDEAYEQFKKEKQQRRQINNLEQHCKQQQAQITAMQQQLDRVTSLLDYIVTGESSDGA